MIKIENGCLGDRNNWPQLSWEHVEILRLIYKYEYGYKWVMKGILRLFDLSSRLGIESKYFGDIIWSLAEVL